MIRYVMPFIYINFAYMDIAGGSVQPEDLFLRIFFNPLKRCREVLYMQPESIQKGTRRILLATTSIETRDMIDHILDFKSLLHNLLKMLIEASGIRVTV